MSRPSVLLVLAMMGCGTTPATVHDAIADFAAIQCEAEFRCCTMQQATMKSGVASASQCQMAISAQQNQFAAAVQTGIDKGVFRYDSGQAQICLDAIRGALSDCNAPALQTDFTNNPFCGNVIQGSIQPGGDCDPANYGGGCAPGSYCTLSHTCKLYAQNGQDCTATLCAVGLACLTTGQCGQPLADGSNCQNAAQCKSGVCNGGVCATAPTVQQAICL